MISPKYIVFKNSVRTAQ